MSKQQEQQQSVGVKIKPGTVAVSVAVARLALGVSHGTMWSLIGSNKIRSVRVGRRRLIPVSALHEFVGDLPKAS